MSGNRNQIIYHADDYAACREVSEHILECYRNGALCSLSVLPNGNALEESMELLAPVQDQIKVSIHFNLAEGHCVAEPSQVPLLVDERGMFHISFFKVLLWSFTGKRKELRREIELEMSAQLARMLPYVKSVRVDSHQHYHMIPIVLKSILKAVEQSGKDGFSAEEYFTRHHDIEISTLAVSMSVEVFKLPERLAVKNDESNLRELVFHLILDFRMNIMECRLRDLQAELAQYANDTDKMREILQAIKQTQDIRNILARKLGNDIVS